TCFQTICIALRSGLERHCFFSLSNSKPYRPRPSQPGFGFFLSGGDLLRGGGPAAPDIAALHAGRDIIVAFNFGDVDFAAPIKPRQTLFTVPRCGSNVDPFVFRPPTLLPKSLTLKDKQIVIVVRHDSPSAELCSTLRGTLTYGVRFVI